MSHHAKVLIVDDNENNRYTLRRRLSRLKFPNTTEAENGQHALDILEQEEHDIILLDVMMPVMDGFEVLERVKLNPRLANIPVIMISALDDLDNVVKAIELGADDYLPKPFNPVLLEARMKAAIRKRKLISIETNYYRDFDKDTNLAKLDVFVGSLESDMNRELDTSFSLVYIRFAQYNFITETLSLADANEYIRQQTERIKGLFPTQGTLIGRLSDNVIAIFNTVKNMPQLADQAAMYQDIFLPLKRAIHLGEESFEGHIGIGISTGKSRECKPQSLLTKAAFACQTALENDSGLAFYDPERHRENIEKFHLEPKLREAINKGQLELHYQAIVNAQSSEIESFEALIRWPQPDGSMISPFKFITLAEETGLIYDIDQFVLDQTCKQIALWRAKYGEDRVFTIGANISAKHWVNPALVEEVKQCLERYQVPAKYLKLEMTESAMIDNADIVKDILNQLSAIGVKVALDDFGTGYSSLGYLIEFPIDILKVDKIFVDDIHTDPKKQALVQHILNIAKPLGMTTIVEGVEHAEQAKILKDLNCHQIQGFYFHKPLPVNQLEEII
jgi:EAL domain-containing protein (putative c-di-GMP-specific phosphodiesterase class I)/DNA-binding response OmpR family regulator